MFNCATSEVLIVVSPDCNRLSQAIAVERARYQQLTTITRRIESHGKVVGTLARARNRQRVARQAGANTNGATTVALSQPVRDRQRRS